MSLINDAILYFDVFDYINYKRLKFIKLNLPCPHDAEQGPNPTI